MFSHPTFRSGRCLPRASRLPFALLVLCGTLGDGRPARALDPAAGATGQRERPAALPHAGAGPKMPIYVYARPGDPLWFVYRVGRDMSMGIIGEGPLRARCFVIDPCYREMTLQPLSIEGDSLERPPTLEALARALDLAPDEVPDDLEVIWKHGRIEWSSWEPGTHVPVSGVEPEGPHRLVGRPTYRIYSLAPGRGSLLIAGYGPDFFRVLRLPSPGREFVVRPGSGLEAMIRHHRLYESDICSHLRRIHRGEAVDWSEVRGYLY